MCLIIAPGKDGKPALLPRDVFDYTYSRNRDGFGGMWVEDGRVQHFKTLGLTSDEIYAQMEERVERNPDIIFHMRLKTHGKIIPGLSHPFRILHKNRHGKDLFFMHNGVLSSFGSNLTYGQSDTTRFKDKMLVPLLTRDPDALEDPEVWEQINKMTSGSRLIFMDSDGKTYLTSPGSWNNRYGLQLSNDYMLPNEPKIYTSAPSVANDTSIGRPTILTGEETHVTGHFVYFRQIDKAGEVKGHWVSCPKLGYIRTESGLLYKDNGPNRKIYHAADYIPKDNEFRHLGLTIVAPSGKVVKTEDYSEYGSAVMEADLDDDVPFDMGSPSVDGSERRTSRSQGSGPAPEDQRLRYARLVNNMVTGDVTSRPHFIADLIGMSDDELTGFIREDQENTAIAFAELVEMVLEYNDDLWKINPNHPKILKPDEIIRIGQTDYHRHAIQEVAAVRRKQYEDQINRLNELLDEEAPADEVHVG